MREDHIQNAVKFLSHPKVKGSPVFHRRSFLKKKGLTKEELDEAFRRVPDPQPNSTDAPAIGSQQANSPNSSSAMQPITAVQSPQAATGYIAAGPVVPLPHTKAQFSWVHALLGAGLFLGIGASAVITIKKLFIPRLKSWTRRVVAEADENVNDELNAKIYEEIKEAVKVSASAFSDIAKTNEEVIASKDEDRKILMKLSEALDAQANVFKSLSETLNRIRENRFSQYNMLEEHVQPAPWNGPIDNHWRDSQINMHSASPNSVFDSGRHSLMPSPADPTYGSFSGSYTEQRLQRPGYGFQHQMSNDRSNLGAQGSYQGGSYHPQAGNAIGSPVAVASESPFQRRWVPPQPRSIIMPEAAAAIRQPRSPLPRQQSQPSDGRPSTDAPSPSESAVAREQLNGGAPGRESPSDASTVMANAGSSGNEQQQQEDA